MAGVVSSVAMPAFRRALVLAVALLGATGCSSSVRARAETLADGGAATARAASDAIGATGSAVETWVEAQLLLAPLTGRPEPGEEAIASLDRARRALGARAEAVRSLADAYTALGALAAYDAAGAAEQGVNALAGAVNGYGEALGQPAPKATTTWTAAKAGGVLAGARQARRLKAGSAAIRESVEHLAAHLRREQEALASVRRVLVEGQGAAVRAFVALGLGRPGALLAPHVSGFGLAWDEKQLDPVMTLLRKEPSITKEEGQTREDDLRRGLEKVLERRVRRRAEVEAAIVDEMIGGLEALAVAHGKFESSGEVDLAGVTERLAAMRAAVDEFRALEGR